MVAVKFLIMKADNLHQLIPKEKNSFIWNGIGLEKGFYIHYWYSCTTNNTIEGFKGSILCICYWCNLYILLIFIVLWGGVMDDIGFHGKGRLCIPSGLTTTVVFSLSAFLVTQFFHRYDIQYERKRNFPWLVKLLNLNISRILIYC